MFNIYKFDKLKDYHQITVIVVVVVAIINNQKSRLILVNMEVLHWRVWDPFAHSQLLLLDKNGQEKI